MIVYLATNDVNGMQYVGAALCLKKRASGHLSAARRGHGSKNSLQEAIRVYGEDNFTFSVLDTAENREDLSEKEHKWINKLNTVHPDGYNLVRGNYSVHLKNSGKHISIKIEGQTFPTINAAAKHYAIVDCTLRQRLKKGYTPEQAVGLEPAPEKRFLHPNMNSITIKGKTFDSERQACLYFSKKLGIKPRTLKSRLSKGWHWDDVLSPEISCRQRAARRNNREYVVGNKTYRTSDELGAAYGISGSYARVLIYKNKGKPLNEIFLEGDISE